MIISFRKSAIVIGLLVCILDQAGAQNSGEKKMLDCRIQFPDRLVKVGVKVPWSIEVTNISEKPIDIFWTRHVMLENLKTEIVCPDGRIVIIDSRALSPYSPFPLCHTLKPGEKLTTKADSFPPAIEAGPKWPSGKYKIQATFQYRDVKATSSWVEVEVKE